VVQDFLVGLEQQERKDQLEVKGFKGLKVDKVSKVNQVILVPLAQEDLRERRALLEELLEHKGLQEAAQLEHKEHRVLKERRVLLVLLVHQMLD